jgi:hypothetical protein
MIKEYLVSVFHKVSITRFVAYSIEENSNNTTYFGERDDTLTSFCNTNCWAACATALTVIHKIIS